LERLRSHSRAAAIEAIYQQYLIDHGLNPADPLQLARQRPQA